jgi:hypothetical protein
MTITRTSFRKAAYLTLAISVLVVVGMCMIILGPRYTMKFAAAWSVQIAVAYLAMIGIIEGVGVRFRASLVQSLAGIGFSFLVFMTGIVAGSATTMLLERDMDVHSYVLKPLFWVGFYGFLPAMIIGLRGSAHLRKIGQRQ